VANPPDYELPKEIDRNHLIKSSVIITNGGALGTGIAISERHILTAAHTMIGHFLDKLPIDIGALNSVKNRYLVPATETPTNDKANPNLKVDFAQCPNTRPLKIKSVHLHPKATLKRVTEEDENTPLSGDTLQEKLDLVIDHGPKSNHQYANNGTRGEYKIVDSEGAVSVHMARVYGPDLAIIECLENHNLPFLEIAAPLSDEKTLLHILGLSGLRYEKDDSTKPIAGAFFPYEDDQIVYSCMPSIYGQRFQPFQTEDGQTGFINRVFMKKIDGKRFFMDDQVYPGAPKGFGLLAGGDSGAGVIVVKDGKPYLAGIARSGDISPIFTLIQEIALDASNDPLKAMDHYGKDFLVEVLTIYNEALKEESREKKWFITQCLSDVTHEKDWITGIIETSEK